MATNFEDRYGNWLANSSNHNRLSSGTSVPVDATTGYSTGAIYQLTNGTTPNVLYENTGSATASAFRPVAIGASTGDGPNSIQTVKGTFDPSGTTSLKATGTYSLAATVPSGALVTGGYARVLTAFSSTNSTATVGFYVVDGSTGTGITAATVGGAPWSTTGTKAVLFNAATAGGGYATTAAGVLKVIVAAEALTGGKAAFYVNYIL